MPKFNIHSVSPTPPLQAPGRRAYDAGTGRFVSRIRMLEYLDGEHPYGYTDCNPTTYIDPSGLQRALPVPPWREGIGAAGMGTPTTEPDCNTWAPSQHLSGLPTSGVRPPLPPGASYVNNCCEAKKHWGDVGWFQQQMHAHGPMDYKYQGMAYDDGGNCNYGIVAACAGIPMSWAIHAAGKVKMGQPTYDPSFGTWYGAWPCGNAPDKQALIIRCYCDAIRNARAFADKCNASARGFYEWGRSVDEQGRQWMDEGGALPRHWWPDPPTPPPHHKKKKKKHKHHAS